MAKTAMVTGAADGIGKGIARELAKNGWDLMIHSGTNAAGAKALAEALSAEYGIRAAGMQEDLLATGAPARIFREFDRHFDHIDLFVNNAGVTEGAPFLDVTEETFDRVVGIDLKGAFFCTQEAAKRMAAKKIPGNIVIIASNLREYIMPNMAVYGPVKAAAARLAKHEAIELAPYGIRVNAIAPGYVDSTERMRPYRESSMRHIPLKKWASVEQVAKLVLHLVSEDGSFFTGSVITMDGGATLLRDPEYDFGSDGE